MNYFNKPCTAEDLQLLRTAELIVGERLNLPSAYYPEAYYRLTAQVDKESDLYSDQPNIVAESSGLFWDPCTNAQILLYAINDSYYWTLALTRFGGLRWEVRAFDTGQKKAELEVEPITHLLDIRAPFYLGLTLVCSDDTLVVRLLVGQNDGMIIEAESTELLSGFSVLATEVAVGCGDEGKRPFVGEITELLVANTTRYQLYDRPELGDVIDGTFPGGSVLAPFYVDDRTISVLPGTQFASTSDNYWYYFLLNDTQVRDIIIEEVSDMNGHFFISEDRDKWTAISAFSIGKGNDGKRRLRLELPERKGGLYIASAMVYGERERDRDLQKSKELGATVQQVAISTLGLPVYVVSLTDSNTPLKNKQGIVLHCGQHSPLEQMGGRLGMPCLEEFMRLHAENKILEEFVFYWIPIFNVDCAHFGTPGNDARCTNPNRHWHENKGPEHIGVQNYLIEQAGQGVDMRFLLDIHMGGWRNHNLLPYYVVSDEKEIDLQHLIGKNAEKTKYLHRLYDLCGIREVWPNTTQSDNPNCCSAWFQSEFNSNWGMHLTQVHTTCSV